MKITFKLSLYLILRVLMICMLCFMCVPLTVSDGFSWLIPVLAVFYLVVLFYFVVFTCWTVGCKDKIKVDAGRQKSNMARGFISSGIVFGILEVLFILSIVITEGLAGQIFNVANMITSFFSYLFSIIHLYNSSSVTFPCLNSFILPCAIFFQLSKSFFNFLLLPLLATSINFF